MNHNIVVSDTIVIPASELEWTFVCSQGPGGQNVNKVHSKAVLRWSVQTSRALPVPMQQRFLAHYRHRISRAGDLLLTSQRYRDQGRNVVDCKNKLRHLILAIANPPRIRRPTKPPRSVTEHRLADKRYRAQKKQRRQSPDRDSF